MKMNNMKCFLPFAALALLAGCSEQVEPQPTDLNEPVELQISPRLSITRSVIQGETQTGADATVMQNIAVYAQSTTANTASNSNNYALYTQSSGVWTATGADKILLSNEAATVYAYYPAYQPGTNNEYANTTARKLAGDASGTSTIPVTTYEGGVGTAGDYLIPADVDNADSHWDSGAWTDNSAANKALIAAAPGEVDYMYATSNPATVTNGKAGGSASVVLTMNHALSMVSFRVYNDGSYKNATVLTKIELKDINGAGHTLGKVNGHTMQITDGTITGTANADAAYTRTINDYTLINIGNSASATTVVAGGSGDSDGTKAAAAASKKFSLLVLPVATIQASEIQAVFTIDGAEYPVNLPATPNAWTKGQNYLYTVRLGGTQLSITQVTVTDWTSNVVSGDLEIK